MHCFIAYVKNTVAGRIVVMWLNKKYSTYMVWFILDTLIVKFNVQSDCHQRFNQMMHYVNVRLVDISYKLSRDTL